MDAESALDRLRRTIEPGVTPLLGVDMVASFVRLPQVTFFENARGAAGFMPTELLRDSLYETLAHFPLLAGRYQVEPSGFLSVAVDRDNLNLPEFQEVECDVHFDELRVAKYSPKLLPTNILAVLVARLRDNSGVVLFTSISHGVVDAVGNCMFQKTWADICRRMAAGEPDVSAPDTSEPVVHDRGVLLRAIPRPLPPSNRLVRHVQVPGNLLSRFIAWLSPESRVKMIRRASASMPLGSNSYYISRNSLDVLRAAVARVVPEKQRVSHNDLLVALTTVVMAQCAEAPRKKRSWLCRAQPDQREFQTSVATDIRPRIPALASAGYSGNGMIKQLFASSFDELQQPVTVGLLAEVAGRVRRATNAVDAEFIQQFVDGVQTSRDCYIRPIVCGPRHPMKILTTNHTRLGYYAIDFGFGTPKWVCPPDGLFPNFVLFLPAPPTMDGYTIFINAPTDILNRVRLHDYWSSITSFLN
ncbi:hypothetical protein IWQ57_001437 [Coemansia nantahalensis]|uniref:Uncharacterized protein n=1 Tax=Coemansia nantahalensis TaxID=2789366 RepID=A0ACC1K4L9_9FUNG|nr:hypothetical protein IWQ57_001437 [Coemansia nantahalensis]